MSTLNQPGNFGFLLYCRCCPAIVISEFYVAGLTMNTPTTLTSKRLRLESENGSPITEYSIENSTVAVRSVDLNRRSDPQQAEETSWQQLTPEQLRFHVERHTVVAEWLKRRLGWRRLLRECARDTAEGQEAA